MNLKNKNIFLISPEPWDHIFVSKHHYATHLAKRGNKVFFLNPPNDQLSCVKTEFNNVYSVQYRGFIRGLRFFPSFFQRYFIRQKFKAIQKLCEVKIDIVWSFDNSLFFDFSALPKSVFCINHIVDLNQDFEFEKATKKADLCLASSNFIFEKQKKYNHNSFNIGHGFNIPEKELKQVKLQGSNKINCGYAGNLDIKYIDWKLVESLLKDYPNIDFHFAGQWKSKAKFLQICNMPNFYFYGKLTANQLPSFYKNMDLLILVYKYEEYPEQLANPHKMMEYLASGNMILATWTEEYSSLSAKGIIEMSKNSKDYIKLFKEVIDNLNFWNSNKLKKSRINFANQNTYENQLCRIEQEINEK